MSETATKNLPFHESIVPMIQRASIYDLQCLGQLIKSTAIPKDHDKIIDTWQIRTASIRFRDWEEDRANDVVEYLRADKKRADAELAEKKGVLKKYLYCWSTTSKDPRDGCASGSELGTIEAENDEKARKEVKHRHPSDILNNCEIRWIYAIDHSVVPFK